MTIGGVFSASVFKSTVYKTGVSPPQSLFDTHDGIRRYEEEVVSEEQYKLLKELANKKEQIRLSEIAKKKEQSENRKKLLKESVFGKSVVQDIITIPTKSTSQLEYEASLNNHYTALNTIVSPMINFDSTLVINDDISNNIEFMRQLLSLMKILYKLDDYEYNTDDITDNNKESILNELNNHYKQLMEVIDD